MNGKERLKALVEGRDIDRTPIGGWYHMPLVDQHVGDFSRELIASTDFNHWDFIKIMTNGHYYTAAYGGKIRFSTDLTKWYGDIEKYPIVSAEDAARLEVLDAKNPVFARELEVLRILKDYYKDEVPLIATIFNPLTAVQECIRSLNSAPVLQLMVEHPEALHKALEAMTQTNLNYLDALFEEGIDGIFLANQYSMAHILTDAQYEEFVTPYEKRVVEHCKGRTWFNMVHAHGDRNLRLDKYYGYGNDEIQALNWENCPAGLPENEVASIAKVRKETDKVIIAGIDQIHDFETPENHREDVKKRLIERYKTAVREVGSNRFVFAPGCAMPTGGSYLYRLLYEVVEEYGYTG